jgi:beta-glucuronidase
MTYSTTNIASILGRLSITVVLAIPALSQQPLNTLLVDVDHRNVVSLNGDWHYLVEQPPAASLYTSDGKVRDDGYALNTHPVINTADGPHNAEYDFATAPILKVPGDWNTQDPTLLRFEGVVWYQRNFEVQPRPHTRTFLHIGAANYRSFIWVNAKRICDHEGGFTPFDCEVTATLHPGSNFVVIAVDSTRHRDDIPSAVIDWFNYGGLTRDVSLVELPEAFIDDYDIHLKRDTTDQLTGYIHVEGAASGTSVKLEIPEFAATINLKTDATGRAPFDLQTKPLTLWSPESPKLYRILLHSGDGALADSLTDDIGFRDIRVDGTRILLNGKPIFLRGVNEQAEAPYRTGRVSNQKDVDTIFAFLKDLDANFVRLAHYPQDERMERTADRNGIMIWSEIPLWQHISFDKPEVYAKAVSMLNEMIRRDRNKASVILWSVSNETPNNPIRTAFLTNLANQARQLDPTRLVTSALIGPQPDGNNMVQNDPLAAALDVVGQNEYIGWYLLHSEDADNIHWTLPDKPVIMSEFGGEAKAGNHGPATQRWTEESQADIFRHQFVMLAKIPQLRGTTPWILMDFRSPTRNLPRLQDGFNRKGLISEDGKKKQAFFLLQKAYKDGTIGKAQ